MTFTLGLCLPKVNVHAISMATEHSVYPLFRIRSAFLTAYRVGLQSTKIKLIPLEVPVWLEQGSRVLKDRVWVVSSDNSGKQANMNYVELSNKLTGNLFLYDIGSIKLYLVREVMYVRKVCRGDIKALKFYEMFLRVWNVAVQLKQPGAKPISATAVSVPLSRFVESSCFRLGLR
jgi:hypothetical protein